MNNRNIYVVIKQCIMTNEHYHYTLFYIRNIFSCYTKRYTIKYLLSLYTLLYSDNKYFIMRESVFLLIHESIFHVI